MSADNALVSSYQGAVVKAEAAARGQLRVAVSPGRLAQAVHSLDGLDTGHLRSQASIAAGTSTPAGVQQSIVSVVWPLLQNLLGGIAGSALVEWASSLFNQKDTADQVAADTCEAADAIDRINLDFSAGSAAILENLTASIDALVAFLGSVSPQDNPEECAAAVAAMQELIDAAGRSLLENCGNRDEAVGQCFDELIERGRSATCQPTPEYAPAVSGGKHETAGGGTPAGEATATAVHGEAVAEATAAPAESQVQPVSEEEVVPSTSEAPCDSAAEPATSQRRPASGAASATIPAACGAGFERVASLSGYAAGEASFDTAASFGGYGAGQSGIGQAAGQFIGSVAKNLTAAGAAVVEGLCEAAGQFQAEYQFNAQATGTMSAECEGAGNTQVQGNADTGEPEAESAPPKAEPPSEDCVSNAEPEPEGTSTSVEPKPEVTDEGVERQADSSAQEPETTSEIPLDQRPEPAPPAEKLAHQGGSGVAGGSGSAAHASGAVGAGDAAAASAGTSAAPSPVDNSCTPTGSQAAASAAETARHGSVAAQVDVAGEVHGAGGVQVHKVGQWR